MEHGIGIGACGKSAFCSCHVANDCMKRDIIYIYQISEPPILLCAKTASDAVELKEYLLTVKELPEDVHTCYKCGIVVGVGKVVTIIID